VTLSTRELHPRGRVHDRARVRRSPGPAPLGPL